MSEGKRPDKESVRKSNARIVIATGASVMAFVGGLLFLGLFARANL